MEHATAMTVSHESATAWPRVSVIIPTWNRAGLVRTAIESALEQNYPHLEVLVVDDGSTDATEDVVKSFGAPVRYIRQANAGAASARNRGIREATGDLVAFLDSDDLFLPGKLQEQVQYFEQRPATVLVYCWFSILDEAGRTRIGRRCRLSGNVARELLWQSMQGPMATPTVLVRRDALFRPNHLHHRIFQRAQSRLMAPWRHIISPSLHHVALQNVTTRSARVNGPRN
jgi:glycosyltransferase involved in cell wall biosynthesis